MSDSMQTKPVFDDYHLDHVEEEVDKDPGSYFLSPSTDEYDSDDDDDGSVEWNAGIDDFALYAEDKKNNFAGTPPDKWQHLETSQQQALQRALARAQTDSTPAIQRKALAVDDVPEFTPDLTPDQSPRLADNLEMEQPVRNYITVIVTPPSDDDESDWEDDDDDEDYDEPLYMRAREPKQTKHTVERPGLRYTRTLSGKRHSWIRPPWDLYTVVDEPELEERAEAAGGHHDDWKGGNVGRDEDEDSLVSNPDRVFEEVDGTRFEMMSRSLAKDVYEDGV